MIKFINYVEDKQFLVMEFAEKGTLHDYLLKQSSPIGILISFDILRLIRMEFETYMDYSINGSNTLFA